MQKSLTTTRWLIKDNKTLTTGKVARRIILYSVLILLSVLYIYPLMISLSMSFRTLEQVRANPFRIFPEQFEWRNYRALFTAFPFFTFTMNSLFLGFTVAVATSLTSAIVGYSFAKFRWPGREVCFTLCLATMMLPAQIIQISQFIMFANMNQIDSYIPLIAPALMGGSAFNIFLIRQFYRGIPKELAESAKIDGAGELYIWWNIMLRMVLPMVLAIGIFAFLNSWNDFYNPLIYLSTERRFTLALGLRGFQHQTGTDWNLLMAGGIFSMIPTLFIFFAFQKYFMEGISISSGVKG